jgi:hypothetical protein
VRKYTYKTLTDDEADEKKDMVEIENRLEEEKNSVVVEELNKEKPVEVEEAKEVEKVEDLKAESRTTNDREPRRYYNNRRKKDAKSSFQPRRRSYYVRYY